MKTIEVPIECRVPNPAGVDYEELGMEEPKGELELRNSIIFVAHIVGFYRDHEDRGCLIHMADGDSYFTTRKYSELKNLLHDS